MIKEAIVSSRNVLKVASESSTYIWEITLKKACNILPISFVFLILTLRLVICLITQHIKYFIDFQSIYLRRQTLYSTHLHDRRHIIVPSLFSFVVSVALHHYTSHRLSTIENFFIVLFGCRANPLYPGSHFIHFYFSDGFRFFTPVVFGFMCITEMKEYKHV